MYPSGASDNLFSGREHGPSYLHNPLSCARIHFAQSSDLSLAQGWELFEHIRLTNKFDFTVRLLA